MPDEPVTDESMTAAVKPLPYEPPADPVSGWPTVVRWTAAATAALAGAYFLNGVAVGTYYVLVGRYGYVAFYGVYLFGTFSWPLYLMPVAAGAICLRGRARRHWAMLKWGLVILLVVRAMVALSNVIIALLAATPTASATANAAGAAMIAQYFFNGVTDVVPPAAMLWLATRPRFREVFRL